MSIIEQKKHVSNNILTTKIDYSHYVQKNFFKNFVDCKSKVWDRNNCKTSYYNTELSKDENNNLIFTIVEKIVTVMRDVTLNIYTYDINNYNGLKIKLNELSEGIYVDYTSSPFQRHPIHPSMIEFMYDYIDHTYDNKDFKYF